MTSWIKSIILLTAAAALFACSNGNSGAPVVDSNGKHPDNWLETHWIAYHQGSAAAKAAGKSAAAAVFDSPCIECHGSDLSGGIAKVGCFSPVAPDGRLCHANKLGHPDGWASPAAHGSDTTQGAMAQAGVSAGFAYCARCHGDDFAGGAGKAVSCFSCHATAPHPPRPWHDQSAGGRSHTRVDTSNAAQCAKCHLNGSAGSTAPGCFNNTMCHGPVEQIGHGSGWLDATSAGFHAKNLNNSCSGCHGADLAGSGSAPSCMSAVPIGGVTCHASAPPTTAPAAGNQCLSCHGGPATGPTGTQAPNRKLGHNEHVALAEVNAAGGCAVCHAGAGSGSAGHAKSSNSGGRAAATVALSATFKLAGATLSYNPTAKTCSGVSCHGGRTTPSWETGAFDTNSNAGCAVCHESGAGNAQAPYNSYRSGKQSTFFPGKNLHDFHLASGLSTPPSASCTDCHGTARLAPIHFIGLDQQDLSLRPAGSRPSDTIGGEGSSVTDYEPSNRGNCTNNCHDTRNWFD